ncbi:MAG: SDR family oxidoreductase [Sphingomicrobium sp.]
MEQPRTAIVTGAGKRVGAAIAAGLAQRGWRVVAHVHHDDDMVGEGMTRVVADLTDPDCAQTIFAAAAAGLPPVRLLVNNAARFAWDGFGAFDGGEFDAHMAVNVKAPLLLGEAFFVAQQNDRGEDALIVNLLDAKLAAPNPDFLSYTLSKQALAGLTEVAARAYAGRGIRVNAIAPALMLRSAGQGEENYRAMHAANPLGRGVAPGDVLAALDYLIASPAVTGAVLTIDGGQRFAAPIRDLQFMETQ